MMNRPNQVHVIGQQQQQQQAAIHKIVVQTYLGLIPVVAGTVLAHAEQFADQDEVADRVATEAWRCARAALAKIGIAIPEDGLVPKAETQPEAKG